MHERGYSGGGGAHGAGDGRRGSRTPDRRCGGAGPAAPVTSASPDTRPGGRLAASAGNVAACACVRAGELHEG